MSSKDHTQKPPEPQRPPTPPKNDTEYSERGSPLSKKPEEGHLLPPPVPKPDKK